MEYTNEFLIRMFFSYAPCEAKGRYTDQAYKVVGIKGGNTTLIECRTIDVNPSLFLYPSTLQLLLTPLSAISSENAIQVAKILLKRHNRHYTEDQLNYVITHRNENNYPTRVEVAVYVCSHLSETVIIEQDAIHRENENRSGGGPQHFATPNTHQATDYLRSKSYDLGFQHIPSLIEAGLALSNVKS